MYLNAAQREAEKKQFVVMQIWITRNKQLQDFMDFYKQHGDKSLKELDEELRHAMEKNC